MLILHKKMLKSIAQYINKINIQQIGNKYTANIKYSHQFIEKLGKYDKQTLFVCFIFSLHLYFYHKLID